MGNMPSKTTKEERIEKKNSHLNRKKRK